MNAVTDNSPSPVWHRFDLVDSETLHCACTRTTLWPVNQVWPAHCPHCGASPWVVRTTPGNSREHEEP